MQYYCENINNYKRLQTLEVNVGGLLIGNQNPIRVQTMTTTDTMNTEATVAQTIKCIQAGAELVRITAPSKNEAQNLANIKTLLNKQGYFVPLVADIHFTPNAAEIAARIVEKVRVNPGNYIDKKKFDIIEYTDADYAEEVEKIFEKFTPLVNICKQYGTAMRIGTNHGSLSDRIMSRYGDTPIGMVESAMEFLRVARYHTYHNIVLSMKSSNPQVMVQAYRLLVQKMNEEFGAIYPLHLGVTEAGDGEDGRIKSAVGIGTLLEDGIGDTVRVSLTEDPELEIPVCKDLIKKYTSLKVNTEVPSKIHLPYNPFSYQKRNSIDVNNIGAKNVPVVVADFMLAKTIEPNDFKSIGYNYNQETDKWHIADIAADYVYTGNKILNFELPGTLKIICNYATWQNATDKEKYLPLINFNDSLQTDIKNLKTVFVGIDCFTFDVTKIKVLKELNNSVLCLTSTATNVMQNIRTFIALLIQNGINNPIVIGVESHYKTIDEQLLDFSTIAGALLVDGFGDGIWLMNEEEKIKQVTTSGRTYNQINTNHQFLNNTAFTILQATRTRISKTEYISCPSCGRTLFDLQETTAKIRAVTNHLKGVKIAIMGCIVNGPGEMADADFGYVGSGVDKITLYKGKEVVKKNIPSKIAVDELINLLKENNAWVEV